MPKIVYTARQVITNAASNARLPRSRHTHVRAKGVHLSGILRVKCGYAPARTLLSPNACEPPEPEEEIIDEDQLAPDELRLKMAMGIAWEEYAVGLHPEIQWQPGQIRMDGVTGSPDGVSMMSLCRNCDTPASEIAKRRGRCACGGSLHVEKILEEFKLTWKSYATHEILKHDYWIYQTGAYCYMQEPPLRFVRFHVCYAVGSYYPPDPIYQIYVIKFEPWWLEEMWERELLPFYAQAEPE